MGASSFRQYTTVFSLFLSFLETILGGTDSYVGTRESFAIAGFSLKELNPAIAPGISKITQGLFGSVALLRVKIWNSMEPTMSLW
jgi:hypothetical protein